MSGHGIDVCACGAVLRQCRCMGPHTPRVVAKTCTACLRGRPVVIPMPPSEPLSAAGPLWDPGFIADRVLPVVSPRVWSKRRGADRPPAGAVYVGRPGPFGNPYHLPAEARAWPEDEQRAHLDRTFGAYLRARPALVARVRAELAGRDLVCWCAPLPCHAEILLRVAAGGEP